MNEVYEELELLAARVDQLAGRVDRLTELVEQLAARIAGVKVVEEARPGSGELAQDADTQPQVQRSGLDAKTQRAHLNRMLAHAEATRARHDELIASLRSRMDEDPA